MTELIDEVLRLERARCAALLAGDVPALSALVDEALRFTHSSGRLDDRNGYIDTIASGRTRYLHIDTYELNARMVGTTVVLEGSLRMTIVAKGVEKRMHNRFTAVWRTDGASPRLTAFASTPIAQG